MVIKPDQTGLMVVIGAEVEDGAWRTRFGVGAYR